MQRRDLPNLRDPSARLTADNAKVQNSAERLVQHIDDLVAALQQADWQKLHELSRQMVDETPVDAPARHAITYRAERVCEELRKPNNIRSIKQSVVRLIGACGRGPATTGSSPGDWQI